ncbi:T9SS C-terminal target domain-containing protein [Hymenobacter perfusus]|uniref:T9SS C-terminal target domain-containing protein n=1 Tax=Hymenobacter perfusus TaxID=1236770 RepID=A0A428KGT6_9BACT|nr:T9SS C-terminal target domain-containing protein [Hymenobacter perfusus]
MKHVYISVFAVFLLLSGAFSAAAQAIWSNRYGTSSVDVLKAMQPVRAGGYLLSGTQGSAFGGSAFFLVRTTATGDTIWTKKQRIRQFTRVAATDLLCEDNAGHVLLIGAGQAPAPSGAVVLLLNQATGDTLWTKTFTGPDAPDFVDLAWSPAQDFVLTANVQGHPYLLRISSSGQITQQVLLDYSPTQAGGVSRLVRGTAGYWVLLSPTVSNASATPKAVFVSDSGVRGPEYATTLTLYYNALSPGRGICSFLPVEGGNFLVVTSGSITKLSPTFTTLWSRASSTYSITGALGFLQAQRSTSGNYVVVGISRASHTMSIGTFSFDPQGAYVGSKGYFGGLDYGSDQNACLQIAPVTGHFVVGASLGADYHLMALAGDPVLAATPPARSAGGRLYPNPLNEQELLTVAVPVPLAGLVTLTDTQGRVLRTWNAAQVAKPNSSSFQVSLQGLAAGMYYLCLEDAAKSRQILRVEKR